MKARTGFVSNSSSSSFIILLDDTNKHLAHYDWKVEEEEIRETDPNRKCHRHYMVGIEEMEQDEYLQHFGFILKKREDKWNFEIWSRKTDILNALDAFPGRSTAICVGEDLLELLKMFQSDEYESKFGIILSNIIRQHGVNNIMFIRESDEGMGGYLPDTLKNLIEGPNVIWHGECH